MLEDQEHVRSEADVTATAEALVTPELSIVMPCLNEAETIGTCIQKAQDFLHQYQVL